MIPKDLFKKVRRIQITTSRLVSDIFAGEYHSVFKGRGMEFDEVREYQMGDDVRAIDWNVTARTGKPYIKKFVEERELTVMLMVDASRSGHFATVNTLKNKLAAEVASVLALSAVRNNDKVGLIVFTDKVEKFIPPRKGLKNVLRVIREVLYFKPQNSGTDIGRALEFLNSVSLRKSVVFLISDFLEQAGVGGEPRFKRPMVLANKKHDLVAVALNDPRERRLEDCGIVTLQDAETGEVRMVDSSAATVREAFRRRAEERVAALNRLLVSSGVDQIDVDTDLPYINALVKFFLKRRHVRV